MSIAVAILAAGRASRFGGGKLDASCAGKPLGRWVLDAVAAAGAPPGLLIVGPDAPALAGEAMAEGWALITNPVPEEGLGGSVALAASHADCLRADALLLLLADMPLIGAERIATLLAHRPVTQLVATRYPSGRSGVPARFPAALFGALAALDGDRGAAVLLRDRADVYLLDMPAEALTDVDDIEGLARAERLLLD
ncbi:MAG TPA: NTP transferase domain-containing protein [Sphingobium sp.]